MDEKNVESWHLLGILLTSMRDWEAARKAVEAGWRVWEERDERDRQMDEEMEDHGQREFTFKDFAAPFSAAALLLPTGTFPPLPPLPESPPTSSQNLAQAIRLRMTLNMIIEKTQGCEEAMVRQQELFAFFSARCSLAGVAKQSATGAKDVPDREEGLGESFVHIKKQGKSSISLHLRNRIRVDFFQIRSLPRARQLPAKTEYPLSHPQSPLHLHPHRLIQRPLQRRNRRSTKTRLHHSAVSPKKVVVVVDLFLHLYVLKVGR